MSSPADEDARDRRLRLLIRKLGATELGRELGLARIRSRADLRATLPLYDGDGHVREVEARLGFGVVEPGDAEADLLVGADEERGAVLDVWSDALGQVPTRIAVLRAASDDALLDRVLLDDVTAFVGKADTELLRLKHAGTRERLLEVLRDFGPDALVMPSLRTCAWLEAELRCPIERGLPSLRWILGEHDFRTPIRSRLPPIRTPWIHRAGRLALPSPRGPRGALTLALGSVLIELLPHDDSLERGRVAPAQATIWPEHAIIGDVYELVVSAPVGYLRLRTGEFVRVIGFDPPTEAIPVPRPRVVRRLPTPIDVEVEGMTLPGAWLTASVRQAFLPEDPALVAGVLGPDPESVPTDIASTGLRAPGDPFAETELGTRAGFRRRPGPRPRGLAVRLEVQAAVDPGFTARIGQRIDADLQRRSPAYAYLRTQGQLRPPRILVAPPGTARVARDQRIASLSGRVDVPIVRVVLPE